MQMPGADLVRDIVMVGRGDFIFDMWFAFTMEQCHKSIEMA